MSLDGTGTTKKQKKGLFGGILGGGKTYFLIALVAGVVAVFAVLGLLGQASARETYYVLGQDVPARAQIVPQMLIAVETNVGGAPGNALNPADVATGQAFSLVPLRKGDPVTESVVGPLERINTAIPDNFVVTSFAVKANDAVAGGVRTGDLVDIFATLSGSDDAVTKLILQRVQVVDVTVDPDMIPDAANNGQVAQDVDPGPASNAVRGGIPQTYTVALSPEDALKLANATAKAKIYVALSSNVPAGPLDLSMTTSQLFGNGAVSDSNAGITLPSPGASASPGADGTQPQPSASTDPAATSSDAPAPSASPQG